MGVAWHVTYATRMTYTYRQGVPVPTDLPHTVQDACLVSIDLERRQHMRRWEGESYLYWGFDTVHDNGVDHVHVLEMHGRCLTARNIPADRQLKVYVDTMAAGGDLGKSPTPTVVVAVTEDYVLPSEHGTAPPGRDLADVPGAIERRLVVAATDTHDVVISRLRNGNPRLDVEPAGTGTAGGPLLGVTRELLAAY